AMRDAGCGNHRSRSCGALGGALRAAVDAARFQPREVTLLRAMIEHDPGDHRGHDQHRRRVGRDDEIGVRTQIHDALPGAACACIISRVRTRRRRISLRMAATWSVTNSKVKAAAITSSGMRIDGSMAEPPSRSTEAPWCSVFHQSTENLMIGILTAP